MERKQNLFRMEAGAVEILVYRFMSLLQKKLVYRLIIFMLLLAEITHMHGNNSVKL